MIPEVVVAMLACARLGAPHIVVSGGLAPSSPAERLKASRATALITVDGARRKGKTSPVKQAVDEFISELGDLHTVIVVPRPGPQAQCNQAATSGTTKRSPRQARTAPHRR